MQFFIPRIFIFIFIILDTVSLTQILAHQPVSNEVMDPHSLLLTDAATDSDMVIGRLLRLSVTLVTIDIFFVKILFTL